MELLESDEEALSPESNASLTDLARRLQAIEYKPESPEGRRVSARVDGESVTAGSSARTRCG